MQDSFDIRRFLAQELATDIGAGDVTGNAVIGASAHGVFAVNARESLVVSGLIHLPLLFSLIDPAVKVTLQVEDGIKVEKGARLAQIEGPARAILAGERTALNLVQHLSGIATETRAYVDEVAGTQAKILDTRKTIPGLRHLQKYAVKCGGGTNHRMGLYDAVLIKDNHIAVAGGVHEAVMAAKAYAPAGTPIQVECDTLDQLEQAISAKATSVLLDNMSLEDLRKGASRARAAGITSEASGNVSLSTVRAIAETGVDRISIGRLTHSVRAVDIGLDEVI